MPGKRLKLKSGDLALHIHGAAALMIICSCNAFTDDDVRGVVADASAPVRAAEMYTCLGCSAQCGAALGPSSES